MAWADEHGWRGLWPLSLVTAIIKAQRDRERECVCVRVRRRERDSEGAVRQGDVSDKDRQLRRQVGEFRSKKIKLRSVVFVTIA